MKKQGDKNQFLSMRTPECTSPSQYVNKQHYRLVPFLTGLGWVPATWRQNLLLYNDGFKPNWPAEICGCPPLLAAAWRRDRFRLEG